MQHNQHFDLGGDPSLPEKLVSFIWHFLRAYKLATTLFILLSFVADLQGPFNRPLSKFML